MLTDAQCRNAKCPPDKKRARFADAGGLYLEVSPAGSKRWFLKIRQDGKETRLAFGAYPAVSLTDARKKRDTAKLQKAGGVNLVQARKIEKLKAAVPMGDTFGAVAQEWIDKQQDQWSAGHTKRMQALLDKDLLPWLGSRKLADIEPVELLAALQKVEDRSPFLWANNSLTRHMV